MKIALLLFIVIASVLAADGAPSGFKITTQKREDTVDSRAEVALVTFSVKCPSGIGQATIEKTEKAWPAKVVLRLHLTGLEFLQLSNGQTKLLAGISVAERKPRLWIDGQENTPLDEKSPLWMPIRAVGADGKTTQGYPLKNGYFEMTLPKAFVEKNPPSLDIHWIDFYRN